MKTKSNLRVLGVLVLALTLAFLPKVASSAMWVGAELGPTFFDNTDVGFSLFGAIPGKLRAVKLDPQVLGGVIIGYDFVKEGFLGYNYPGWMRYFSFAIDFTYNSIGTRSQFVTLNIFNVTIPNFGPIPQFKGNQETISFLFMGKYGFCGDSEVPFGRVVPYLGVGPALVITSIQNFSLGGFFQPSSGSTSTDLGIVAEAGVRFMCLKNVSVDVAFRYRYAHPTFSFSEPGGGNGGQLNAGANANIFNAIVRANLHF